MRSHYRQRVHRFQRRANYHYRGDRPGQEVGNQSHHQKISVTPMKSKIELVHFQSEEKSSKEAYIAWRQAWKAAYANISNSIRLTRLAFKAAQSGRLDNVSDLRHELLKTRGQARNMMALLAAAKRVACKAMQQTLSPEQLLVARAKVSLARTNKMTRVFKQLAENQARRAVYKAQRLALLESRLNPTSV